MDKTLKPAIKEKVELHVHLDGAIRPETVLDLGRARKISLGADTVDELKKRIVVKEHDGLQKVLESFAIFVPTIAGDREAIKRVAYEFCEDCSKHGVIYSEARFSPHLLANDSADPYHAHDQGDLSAQEVVRIVTEAFKQGSHDFNIKVNTILCCVLGMPAWSKETVSLCEEFRDRGVVALDLCSGEYNDHLDWQYLPHVEAFQKAYQLGIHRTVHAGEVTGPQSVKTAVDTLRAERIGHGYHVLEDPAVYEEIRLKNIHLEACPTSPLLTGALPEAVSDITKHAILRFARDDVNFSINTDDPLPMDLDISTEYEFASRTMGLSNNRLIKCIFNAAESSFASPNDKRELIQRLEGIYGKRPV